MRRCLTVALSACSATRSSMTRRYRLLSFDAQRLQLCRATHRQLTGGTLRVRGCEHRSQRAHSIAPRRCRTRWCRPRSLTSRARARSSASRRARRNSHTGASGSALLATAARTCACEDCSLSARQVRERACVVWSAHTGDATNQRPHRLQAERCANRLCEIWSRRRRNHSPK